MEVSQHITKLPFWGLLTDQQKETVQKASSLKKLEAHCSVFNPTTDSGSMMFIIKGNVKLCRNSNDDREIILRIIGPQQYISLQPIFGSTDLPEYAESVNECIILKTSATELKSLIQHDWQICQLFIGELSESYNRMVGRFIQTHQSVLIHTHVVDLLLELAQDIGRKVGDEVYIEHGLTQSQLASIIHRTRQSVTVVLNKLRGAELIHYTRTSILIRDMDGLKNWGMKPLEK